MDNDIINKNVYKSQVNCGDLLMKAGERLDIALQKILGHKRYGAAIAKEYGVTTQAISQLKKKEKSNDLMRKIAKDKGISLSWLEFGEGDMLNGSTYSAKNMVGNIGSVGGHVITGDGHGVVHESPGIVYGEDEVVLPYYPETYASAGGGAFNGFDASSPVSISRSFLQSYFGISAAKGLHIINVVGDSMEPTLKNGEMIFVNPIENEGFRDGGVYVLMCGDTILVKRVRQHPITKEYTLISDNPAVEDITLTIDESSDCKFVGRVVGSMGVV